MTTKHPALAGGCPLNDALDPRDEICSACRIVHNGQIMLLFTWNLGKSERALTLALTYLTRVAASETVFACLQELPDPLPPTIDPLKLISLGLGAAAPILAQRRALFVHSANVSCIGSWNVAQDRMQIAQWRLDSGTEFFAAGIHAIDRRNYSVAEVRGGYAALTRHALDERWVSGAPLLMLGDFNAWPDQPEIGSRACFFGVTSSYEHRPANDFFFGRTSPPLYRIEPSPGVSPGTYFDTETSCWRDIDHIYISGALRQGAQARRLDAIGQESLVSRQGRPSGGRFSDHLPVEAVVALA